MRKAFGWVGSVSWPEPSEAEDCGRLSLKARLVPDITESNQIFMSGGAVKERLASYTVTLLRHE